MFDALVELWTRLVPVFAALTSVDLGDLKSTVITTAQFEDVKVLSLGAYHDTYSPDHDIRTSIFPHLQYLRFPAKSSTSLVSLSSSSTFILTQSLFSLSTPRTSKAQSRSPPFSLLSPGCALCRSSTPTHFIFKHPPHPNHSFRHFPTQNWSTSVPASGSHRSSFMPCSRPSPHSFSTSKRSSLVKKTW